MDDGQGKLNCHCLLYLLFYLQDKKSFIFKGAPFDKIDSMLEKLQSDFPKAKLWSKPDPPTESQLADNEQCILAQQLLSW